MTTATSCSQLPHAAEVGRPPGSLVFAAVVALVVYEVTRVTGGFQRIRALIVRRSQTKAFKDGGDTVQMVCSAVAAACALYPRTVKCLQRSSVIVYLLRMYGVHADLVFGVQRFPFFAHAWVEVDGHIVNDRNVTAIYKTIGRI
jgi:hypothetical protein